MKQVKMLVIGRVQGVGFRYMTKMVADQIGVGGIVYNQDDGSVYIEANGTLEQIDEFIKKIRNSPTPSGRVDQLSIEEDSTIEIRNKFSVTN
ncbi:acylphosphatase [Carnobacterium gallinarum]|uniref:acylphosphatase n=1 Tax=Carnobacterium gallinarum TaxID=2749 RepID=UPI00054E391D|nr:acylphosphatase [Carnobacterium gallinarum]